MSTHNIGFYEEIAKILSILIKYHQILTSVFIDFINKISSSVFIDFMTPANAL